MTHPRTHALAFRIWAYADPLGWNCTIREVAEQLGVSFGSVKNTAASKSWLERFRANNETAASAERFSARGQGALAQDAITTADYRARAELDE